MVLYHWYERISQHLLSEAGQQIWAEADPVGEMVLLVALAPLEAQVWPQTSLVVVELGVLLAHVQQMHSGDFQILSAKEPQEEVEAVEVGLLSSFGSRSHLVVMRWNALLVVP